MAYGPEHQYSKTPSYLKGMTADDIKKNGFKVQCRESLIEFNVVPNSDLCAAFLVALENAWKNEKH
ncbi:hypothetical protein GHV20_003910 [Klebsiella oxytoca]|uniref:hypothetical protein n=1 Tax=Klebsiella oxytoca TaxID=571 RepID=UPI0018C77ED4|nr:hypothetical protein [Klebsiella oxytoca]MBG2650430.1 hypothetical protein [Klebsiella oxytoca]